MAEQSVRRRLAVVASHPIQYHAPLYRELASQCDLTVYFSHRASGADQARAGFQVAFEWDVDIFSGYEHIFLDNVASDPGPHHFGGCDTPSLFRYLANGKYDAILIQGWHLKSYLQALFYAKRLRIPSIARGDSQLATPRSALKRSIKSLTYPVFLRQFDAALYVGKRSKAYWSYYGYPDNRLFFSPHCIDTEWFADRASREVRAKKRTSLGISPNVSLLLFAGKLIDIKRPLDLVYAAALMRTSGIQAHLLIAGAGPLGDEITSTASALGVPLHSLGFCNQSEMPAAYAAADLLVLPSENETWGLVANEALACGTPILLSNQVGSADDLAADRSAGDIYQSSSISDLSNAASRLLNYPPKKSDIRAKSHAYSIKAASVGVIDAVSAITTKQGRS